MKTPLLLLAGMMMGTGLVAHDILLADGIKNYGQTGIASSVVFIGLTFGIAWYAYGQRRNGRLRA